MVGGRKKVDPLVLTTDDLARIRTQLDLLHPGSFPRKQASSQGSWPSFASRGYRSMSSIVTPSGSEKSATRQGFLPGLRKYLIFGSTPSAK